MSFEQSTSSPKLPENLASLVELVQWRAVQQPEQTAFTFLLDGETSEVKITYAQLHSQAQTIAIALQSKTSPGDRAILLYQPGLEYIAAFFGCLYAGVIAVPAYLPLPDRPSVHLRAIIRDAQANLILSTELIHLYLQHLFESIPELAHLDWLLTDDLTMTPPPETTPQFLTVAPLESSTIAFLQYTSGSTSVPRGVMVSHTNLLANLALLKSALVPPGENLGVTWLPPYHDMGLIGGILLSLYSGIATVLMSPVSFLQRPRRWLEAISRTRATISGGPNFAYDLCVRKIPPEQRVGLDLSSWRSAAIGAEPVRASTIAEFSAAFAPCGFRQEAFYPCYGLAEATLMVTCKPTATEPVCWSFDAGGLEKQTVVPIPAPDEGQTPSGTIRTLVSSGQVPPGQHIEIVAPDSGKPCQALEVGEIWVKGPGVASGYWNRPVQSARTFRANLAGSGEGPFLRTGDSGFFYQQELYIAGRLKDMLIIHGRNHFPQDLELTAQNSHTLLRPGGGAAFSIEKENAERLVIVHELARAHQSTEAELEDVVQAVRKAIWQEHELEVFTVVLLAPGVILKTSSGKIRRSACRSAFLKNEFQSIKVGTLERGRAEPVHEYAAPRTRTEELLRDIWSELLDVEREKLGIYDNLFELGGHSLSMAQIVSRIRDVFQLELPANTLFEAHTIADLARYLETLPSSANPEFPPIEPGVQANQAAAARFPLSFSQERMWFFEQAVPGSTGPGDNIPLAVRFKGQIHFPALLQSLQTIIQRHDALRTVFTVEDTSPFQVVYPYGDEGQAESPVASIMVLLDITTKAAQEREDEVLILLRKEQYYVFDLLKGPLVRIKIIKLAEDECVLLINMHHIISDGWSVGVFMQELSVLYRALSLGLPSPLPALPVQYTDYALWQQRWLSNETLAPQLAYWEKQLAGAPGLLTLPTDHPRPPVRSYQGARYPFVLPQLLSQELSALSRSADATLFMTLLTAFDVLLYLHSTQSDIVVGSYVANRMRTETEKLVGLFANLVALRTNLDDGNIHFQELLRRVRSITLDAYAHQDVPFQHVVERLHLPVDLSHTTLFQVMLIMQYSPPSSLQENWDDIAVQPLGDSWIEWDADLAPCDLELHMLEGIDGRIYGDLCYSTDLFERSGIQRLMEHFQSILAEAVSNPERLLKEFR